VTPLILAVDTTHEHGSLALARAGDLLEQVALESASGFAHVIYAHLEGLLGRHGVSVGDIDCFAAASGPGAFTGVRVCLACVKGLAEAAGKPAVAVSDLAAIASFGTAPLRAALLDARRGEVYAALYDAAGCLVRPEAVAPPARWLVPASNRSPPAATSSTCDTAMPTWRLPSRHTTTMICASGLPSAAASTPPESSTGSN